VCDEWYSCWHSKSNHFIPLSLSLSRTVKQLPVGTPVCLCVSLNYHLKRYQQRTTLLCSNNTMQSHNILGLHGRTIKHVLLIDISRGLGRTDWCLLIARVLLFTTCVFYNYFLRQIKIKTRHKFDVILLTSSYSFRIVGYSPSFHSNWFLKLLFTCDSRQHVVQSSRHLVISDRIWPHSFPQITNYK